MSLKIDFEKLSIEVREIEEEMVALAKRLIEKGFSTKHTDFDRLIKDCRTFSAHIDTLDESNECPQENRLFFEHLLISVNFIRSLITLGNIFQKEGPVKLIMANVIAVLEGLEHEASKNQFEGGFWVTAPHLLCEALKKRVK